MTGRLQLCVALAIGLFAAPAAPSGATEDLAFVGEELDQIPLPPSFYERTLRLPVFHVDGAELRFVTAFKDMNRSHLTRTLAHYSGAASDRFRGAPILFDRGASGFACNCADFLQDGEFLISEVPIFDFDRNRYVSLNDESYKAIMELRDYPLQNDLYRSVSFSELVYVNNARAIARFLDGRGFDLVTSYGFMDSTTYPGREDTQFALIRERQSDRHYVAVRGTSGVLDLKTSIDATMKAWSGAGAIHKGFAAITQIVLEELKPYRNEMRASGHPVLAVGHSLGGAVSILLTLVARQEGDEYLALSYAPPPIGDSRFVTAYEDLGPVLVNMFLPGEELDTADRPGLFQWIRLVGDKRYLPDVGQTAGVTHFVINYLKAILKQQGGDVGQYEDSLLLCVLEKFPCFDRNILAFAPLCLFEEWRCFEESAELLLGLEPQRQPGMAIATLDHEIAVGLGQTPTRLSDSDRAYLNAAQRSSKLQLLDAVSSTGLRHLLLLRTGLHALLLRRPAEAERIFSLLRSERKASPIVQHFHVAALALMGKSEQAAAMAARLLSSSLPPQIEFRTERILTHLDNL